MAGDGGRWREMAAGQTCRGENVRRYGTSDEARLYGQWTAKCCQSRTSEKGRMYSSARMTGTAVWHRTRAPRAACQFIHAFWDTQNSDYPSDFTLGTAACVSLVARPLARCRWHRVQCPRSSNGLSHFLLDRMGGARRAVAARAARVACDEDYVEERDHDQNDDGAEAPCEPRRDGQGAVGL